MMMADGHDESADVAALNQSLDTIWEYVKNHLRDDWLIEISMGCGDIDVSLIEPEGEFEHVDVDHGDSVISAMCRRSHEG